MSASFAERIADRLDELNVMRGYADELLTLIAQSLREEEAPRSCVVADGVHPDWLRLRHRYGHRLAATACEALAERFCGHCGGSLDGKRVDAIYCSGECRYAAWEQRNQRVRASA